MGNSLTSCPLAFPREKCSCTAQSRPVLHLSAKQSACITAVHTARQAHVSSTRNNMLILSICCLQKMYKHVEAQLRPCAREESDEKYKPCRAQLRQQKEQLELALAQTIFHHFPVQVATARASSLTRQSPANIFSKQSTPCPPRLSPDTMAERNESWKKTRRFAKGMR